MLETDIRASWRASQGSFSNTLMYINGKACSFGNKRDVDAQNICSVYAQKDPGSRSWAEGVGRSGHLGSSYDRPRKIVPIGECSLFTISMKRECPDPHTTILQE